MKTLEELFIEKYNKLEKKIEHLEKEINEKNKKILEFENIKEDIKKSMWIDKNLSGEKYIYFFWKSLSF